MTDSIASLRDELLQLKSLHDGGALGAQAYAAARDALERRLLVATGAEAQPSGKTPPRVLVATLAVTLLVAAAGYAWTGAPAAIGSAAAAPEQQPQVTQQQIAGMVERLAQRLADQPDDAEGWRMLGRSYLVLDKPGDAVAAYERLLKLRPGDATALVETADALAGASGGNLEGRPLALLQQALAIEPDNAKGLMLFGTAAFNRGNYAAALAPWQRMVAVGPAGDELVQQARLGIDEAQRRIGSGPAALAAATPVGSSASAPGAGSSGAPAASRSVDAPAVAGAASAVSGTVVLAPALAASAAAGDTVFVVARAVDGPRMPLAVLRKRVAELPFAFTLDDSLAMSPAARISGARQVIVVARISRSGQPTAQPGDLEGTSAPLALGATGVVVTIAAPVR